MSGPKELSAIAAIASLSVVTGAAAYDPPLPQNRILPPELGPIEPIEKRLAASLPPIDGIDVVISALGFGPDGRIVYVVMNRGREATSNPTFTWSWIASPPSRNRAKATTSPRARWADPEESRRASP